jgi:CRP-like cAMP-binding protein
MELEQSVLFQGIAGDALQEIRALAKVRNFLGNEVIFEEGDPAHDLYILRDGRVVLTFTLPQDSTTEMRIAQVHPGETFAWPALAKEDTLSARARAMDDSSAFIIPAEELHAIFRRHPAAGYEVMTQLADQILSRLRQSRKELRWLHHGAR